jgi:CrcB protein
MVRDYLAVAIGSALGGMLRFAIAGWVTRQAGGVFPWGTLAVNVAGCALIGVLAALFTPPERGFPWRLFLLPGFCGGFTTFSAFSLETLGLWRTEHGDKAMLYIAASLVFCLLAVWAGLTLGGRVTGNSSN